MIDRALAVAGIAVTLVIAVLQYFVPQLPAWALPTGLVIGAALIGVSIGLAAAGGLGKKRRRSTTASLRLHVYGDHRTPELLESKNIFRWYYLQSFLQSVGPTGVISTRVTATLFVCFDDDVAISTCRVRSPDMMLPVHEVKDFNQRFAIVVFSGAVPSGTLEVAISP